MSDREKVLLFYVQKQCFALRLPLVERITMSAQITPLPQAPKIVLGVIDVQGDIFPVIDTRKRFSMKTKNVGMNDYFIIGKTGNRKVALLVDNIGEIETVTSDDIIDGEDILPKTGPVEGALKLRGDIIFIHDLEKCLSLNEERQLSRALKKSNLTTGTKEQK